jgi:hypothetical protein
MSIENIPDGFDFDDPTFGMGYTIDEEINLNRQKDRALEATLGPMADMIGYAMMPLGMIGTMRVGQVDMYYYPTHIEGTGFATMELIKPHGKGPVPNRLGTYELVAFTKQPYNHPEQTPPTAFNQIERRICDTFSQIAILAREKALNPFELCKLTDADGNDKYVIFDAYEVEGKPFKVGEETHHLLLCLEIKEEELATVAMFGHQEFVGMLKMIGIYPYSDLDRNWVGVRG